jgi:hypothetical protein
VPRRSSRKLRKPSYKRRKHRQLDLQKWLLNLVIFCLAIVVVGFIFSMGKRFTGSQEKVQLSQVNTMSTEKQPVVAVKPVIIEVLNGCGVPGVAQQFTNYLRQEGFDVIYTGNADRNDYSGTILVARTNNNAITSVNTVMMLEQERLLTRIDSSVQADVSLIIGKDYNRLPVYHHIQEIKENF